MRATPSKRIGGLAATALLASAALAATAPSADAQPASTTPASVQASAFAPVKNVGNGLCLQPAGGSTQEFAPIVQATCVTGSLAQGWSYTQVGTHHYRFLNQLSGYCFDAFDGASDGARLLQGTCKSISNEEFNTGTDLPDVVELESRVGFRDTGFCVDVPESRTTPGLALQIWECNGTLAQRWVVGF
ncbi:RICIN domain-containing protein [Streptomyces sp. NPDC090106]|uniref:RICIN domain-containing protein n=1 Tax=Streptomyces sp. NPDC090106 TaxID=3365946 RepID=UPI00382884BD